MTDQHHAWTAEEILNVLREDRETLRDLGVLKIGLFGSYLHGNQRPDSDMDFLFTMEDMTFSGWMDVWNFLEDRFGCSVDLVPVKDLREELRATVLHEVRYVEDLQTLPE